MESKTIKIGKDYEMHAMDRISLTEYTSPISAGTVMLMVHTNQATVTVHSLTPSQLRELAKACNEMADAVSTVALQNI